MTLFFFEIFSLRFIQRYSNPDIAPYEDTNIRLLRSREWIKNPEFRVPPKFGMTNVVFDRQPQ
jgi:hypothetical protein